MQAAATRTQSRLDALNALDRVREAARRDRRARFTALLHHVTVERLWEGFYALKHEAAPGVNGITWEQYDIGLEDRLRDLHRRIHENTYRAQPSLRVFIPKADGRQRPLGIAALEDKIVQQTVVRVLNQIYEVDFLGFSYGFRPRRSPHDALDALWVGLMRKKVNWVLDADIRGFFDYIDHGRLLKFLEHRIADRRILRLIQQWLRAGVSENGQWTKTEVGTPQGAVATPPTMLRTILLGATLKRGGTDPIHNADLALINLDLLDQGADDLPLGLPVRLAESFGNLTREFLQPADHQPQFRLAALLSNLPYALLLQAREPLPHRADPRLEFGLLEDAFFICINQSRNGLFDLVDQLPHLVHLATVIGPCLLLTAFVLDPDSLGLGEQATYVLTDRGIQHVGTDLLVPA